MTTGTKHVSYILTQLDTNHDEQNKKGTLYTNVNETEDLYMAYISNK